MGAVLSYEIACVVSPSFAGWWTQKAKVKQELWGTKGGINVYDCCVLLNTHNMKAFIFIKADMLQNFAAGLSNTLDAYYFDVTCKSLPPWLLKNS